jgi:hypothetical protein
VETLVSQVSVVVLVALTSLGACLVGARRLDPARRALGGAVRATLEAVGLGALFLVANLGLTVLGLALIRGVAGHFVSAYAVDDLALVSASLLQGMVFRWWWGGR